MGLGERLVLKYFVALGEEGISGTRLCLMVMPSRAVMRANRRRVSGG